MYIHRRSMNGGARCGAKNGGLSNSGLGISCPDCLELQRPRTREEQLEALRKACEEARQRTSSQEVKP